MARTKLIGVSRGSLALVFGLLAAGSFSGCEKTIVHEAAGNSSVIIDTTSDKVVDGQDITIKRLRIVKSNDNGGAPGVASIRDHYYVDIWATLSGEEKPRYGSLGPYLADADGNLYKEGSSPGMVVYNNDIAAGLGESISYTITGTDGLISTEWDASVESLTTLAENGARTVVTRGIVKPSEQDASFSNIRLRSYASTYVFSRYRYQNNSDFSVKGRLGCFNKTTVAAGNSSYDAAPTFYDVELGDILSDTDGVISSTQASTDDSSASDQILWIKWAEAWYVTGVNINTRTVRMIRERAAPFYMNRELPKRVITNAASGAAAISGVETMVRACSNAVEVTTGAKTFHTSGYVVTSGSTTYSSFSRLQGDGATHCAGTKSVATTVALTTAFTGATTVFAGCPGLSADNMGISVGAGTWDGTKSSGTITSVTAGTFTHLEHSAIVPVTY